MRLSFWGLYLALALIGVASTPIAWADQIILKDGKEYSGKFVRGDASVVEFRILGQIESFKTSEVAQIVFKEPEVAPAPAPTGRSMAASPREQTVRQVPPQVGLEPSVTFPEGTALTIRTSSAIDTDRNKVGETFTATVEEPLVLGSQTIVARGAETKGIITQSKEAGRIAGKAELALELIELSANGKTYRLTTGEYSEVGTSRGKNTAKKVAGVATMGAIIGAIAGGGQGAAAGATAGAAAGIGIQILTKGETLKIPAETVLEFKLQSPLTLAIP